MSDEKKPEKDAIKKNLSKEILEKQILESQNFINYIDQQITELKKQAQQQIGAMDYCKHLLTQFEIPSEPKPDPKVPLEVK